MSAGKHTPTPWRIKDNALLADETGLNLTVSDATGEHCICSVSPFSQKDEHDEPNALRIVHCVNNFDALVEALELLHSCCDRRLQGHPEYFCAMESARAALDKARGGAE
jgi:hypothetical protein